MPNRRREPNLDRVSVTSDVRDLELALRELREATDEEPIAATPPEETVSGEEHPADHFEFTAQPADGFSGTATSLLRGQDDARDALVKLTTEDFQVVASEDINMEGKNAYLDADELFLITTGDFFGVVWRPSATYGQTATLSLTSSWVAYGGTRPTPKYVVDPLGWWSLVGAMKSGSDGTFWTIPNAGNYTIDQQTFVVATDSGTATVTINTDGTVDVAGSSGTLTCLDGVRWRMDPAP